MIISSSSYEAIDECYEALCKSQKNSATLNNVFSSHSTCPNYFHPKMLDKKAFETNPYYELLKNVHYSSGSLKIKTRSYAPGEAFLLDEIYGDKDKNYLEVNPIGFFETGFSFPEIEKKGRTWMSLIPHEINTMKEDVDKAHGKVLTMGLGLGYYAYMVSEKASVTEVDVLENDPNVIASFNEILFPLFPHKEKIKIIKINALEFSKKATHDYDFVFCDLYHNEEDGLPIFLSLRHLENNLLSKNGSFTYWINESILTYLRRYLVSLLYEEKEGSADEDYLLPENFEDTLFSSLHEHLRNVKVSSKSDVLGLLSNPSLARIAKDLKF